MTLRIERTFTLAAFALFFCLHGAAFAQPPKPLWQLADEAFRDGYAHHTAGRLDEAIDAYSRSIRIRAGNAPVWFNRGLVYMRKGQDAASAELYLNAVADFTEALKLSPGNASYLQSRGNTYYALRPTDAAKYAPLAVADYTEFLRTNPNDGTVHRRRGEAYGDMGKTASALADFARAIEIDPRDKLAYFRRGVLRANRDLPGARQDFEAALRIDPSDADARRWLDWVRSKEPPVTERPTPPPPVARPTPTPPVARPTPSPTPVAERPGTAGANPWDAPLAEAKRLIAARQYDRAETYLKAEIAKVPASREPLVNLFNKRHRALLSEQLARVKFERRDHEGAIQTLVDAMVELQDAITDDLWALNSQIASMQSFDAAAILYEMRIPTSIDLYEIGKRGFGMFEGVKLSEDLTLRMLPLAVMRVGAGENAAKLLQTVATGELARAEECRKHSTTCGPRSRRDETAERANRALEKMNRAISIAPALNELYSTRARIHRFLGKTAAAAADEAKAAQK